MVECLFTLDYEIYGNGEGALQQLVWQPANELQRVFEVAAAKLVVFVEAAELETIEIAGSDPAIHDVKNQLRELHRRGHEIALHLHPQWCNAKYRQGQWELDNAEYNLCVLPPARIEYIVDRAIVWLRNTLDDPDYAPVSFRAGNWLFQPTGAVAQVLAAKGVKVDSSVFKGGLQRRHRLDYRAARRNGWHWRFRDEVNDPDANGAMLELPIYTEMVPFWHMLTGKRIAMQKAYVAVQKRNQSDHSTQRAGSFRDYLRLRYPMKFDFCRMTLAELTAMVERVLREDAQTPSVFKPMVAIGHTKDPVDIRTVEAFLAWLHARAIPVTTLAAAWHRCVNSTGSS